ncbi:MAG: orotate phosphoribosyltransferase [Endomicrobia bacterium]|nr:orotate phosphoribosyltransferase [Endomicrobiia bacterium]
MEFRKESIIEVFKSFGAILEGHFLLSSGLHSDKYIQCALVLQYPDIAEKIAMLLFEEIRNNCNYWQEVTVVVSPALGGVIIGQELARVIRTFSEKPIRAIFTERDDYGKMILRRGFSVNSQDRVIIVEDVVTTGKSTKEVIDVIKQYGGNVVMVCSIFNRQTNVDFGIPYFYISKVEVNNYPPEVCPLCKQNVPIVKPGSRKILG